MSFIIFLETRNTIAVGLSDPYRRPRVSIFGVSFHFNIAQYITYKIYKLRLLQYWANWNLNHMADWEVIDLKSFKIVWDKTTVHISHYITEFTSNNLSTTTILQQQWQATTNLFPHCVLAPETIQNLYQCTHKGSHGRWKASVDALWKWLKAWNRDPKIAIILVDTLSYISGERNDLSQFPNLTLHSDILHIGCPSIILGFILTSISPTQQTYLTHTGNNKRRLKLARQLITHIWNLIYGQWIHHSIFKC